MPICLVAIGSFLYQKGKLTQRSTSRLYLAQLEMNIYFKQNMEVSNISSAVLSVWTDHEVCVKSQNIIRVKVAFPQVGAW